MPVQRHIGYSSSKPRRYFSNGQWGLASDLVLTVVVIGGYCCFGGVFTLLALNDGIRIE